MKGVGSSTLGAQTVDILLLTPDNGACVCFTGIEKLVSTCSTKFAITEAQIHVCEGNSRSWEGQTLQRGKGIAHKKKYTKRRGA